MYRILYVCGTVSYCTMLAYYLYADTDADSVLVECDRHGTFYAPTNNYGKLMCV